LTLTGAAAQTRDIDTEIDRLLARQLERPPFLHPAWLRVWFEEFGADREPVFIRAGSDDATLAIATLMREDSRLTFMGDSSVCDFMDFLVVPDRADEAYQAVWTQVCDEEWSELSLWGLMACSPSRPAIKALAAASGYDVSEELEAVAPRLALPSTWDDYTASLGKKDRHELRRKMRRLLEGGAAVDLRVVTDQAEVSAAMEEFLALHTASRQDKADFMSGQMAVFFRRMASVMAAAGLLRLFMLHLNAKPAASVLCFDAGSHLYLYNSGYDPALAGLSVGLVSKAQCLGWAIENGKQGLDFLRGNEPYKYDLGAQDQEIFTLTVRR
jgi:CelD/BcsL family acetyltransferase involved in cellulose biosynthesis